MAKTVCVTGAGGFIASWIVLKLLKKGYKVHGTVRDPENDKKYGHLKNLEGAKERLTLFKANVLDYDSLVPAIRGCETVIHTACPFFWKFDTMEEVLDPAVKGTQNVLKIYAEEKIKRVVMASSGAAVMIDVNRPEDKIVDESCWTDSEYCKENKLWYLLAKTESERVAWDLAKEHKLDLVVVCPVYVFGPLLQPTLNSSVEYLKNFIDGSTESYPDSYLPVVDVRDVAKAHILAMEDASASGRYFCVERSISHKELLNIVKQKFPQLPCATKCHEEENFWSKKCLPPPDKTSNKKVQGLIHEFLPLEETISDTVVSLQQKQLL